jgi:hypothetical protein
VQVQQVEIEAQKEMTGIDISVAPSGRDKNGSGWICQSNGKEAKREKGARSIIGESERKKEEGQNADVQKTPPKTERAYEW